MGLLIKDYKLNEFDITIPVAYARLVDVNILLDGDAKAIFEIQQNREDVGVKKPFERKYCMYKIDKNLPIHEQIYTKAKADIFIDWEDDIVEQNL